MLLRLNWFKEPDRRERDRHLNTILPKEATQHV
jgi:hypothetical protein